MARASKWLKALFQPLNPADVPVTIKCAAGQTAKALEVLSSADAVLFDLLSDGRGAIRYVEVAISIAEMKALRATPKTLVAAPAAGYLLQFLSGILIYDYAAAYTETAGDDLAVRYTNGSGAIASTTLDSTGFLTPASDQIRTIKQLTTDITPVAAAALVLHNVGGDELAGTGSPVRAKIAYRVHATGL